MSICPADLENRISKLYHAVRNAKKFLITIKKYLEINIQRNLENLKFWEIKVLKKIGSLKNM